MDKFERALFLMQKWDNSDMGATTKELIELIDCIEEVMKQLKDALFNRLYDSNIGEDINKW